MYCTGCGAKYSPDSHFCRECGHKIEAAPHKISEEEYDRALPEDERVTALMERAYRFRKSGELNAAIALCQEAISIKPDSAAAHSMLGQLCESIGDREKAILEYETVVQLNPGSVADRLKLDQLRGSGQQVVQRQGPLMPVFAHHSSPERTFAPAPLLLVGAACGLVLFSAAAGYMIHSRSSDNQPTPPANTQADRREPQKIVSNPSPQLQVNNPTTTIPTPNGPQPVYVYQQPPPPTKIVYVPTPGMRVSGIRTHQNHGTNPGAATSQRVVLIDPPDEVSPSSDGTIKITVSPVEHPKTPKPNSNDSSSQGGIRISQSLPKSKVSDSTGMSSAQPLIMMGNQLKMQEKYPQAIDYYKKSLAVSGDGSADVNQKIAMCYQLSGKKQSARTYYQTAIDSYLQLEKEGRLTDAGRSGLKASESGIKLCE